METDSPEQWPTDARERLTALERAFADAEHRAQKYVQERDQAQAQSKTLQEETHALQHDYASLRLQKGGFGFKSLLFVGMIGTIVGLLVCYLFIRPKNLETETFRQFREQNQFNIELAISKGEFAQADSILNNSLHQPLNQPIKPEIEFARKIAGAAWRRCEK